MATSLLMLAALVAAWHEDPKPTEPTFQFKLDKRADSITPEKEKDRTVFIINGESGIGGAEISIGEGQWPERVTLRLRYGKDKPFHNLESFALRTDRIMVSGTLKNSGKMPFCFVGPNTKPDALDDGNNAPAGFLDVSVKETDAGLEVNLPANLLRGNTKVKLSWIDAFRR